MIEKCMKVVVDCDFSELMKDGELNSLCTQLMYGHSENKKSENPVKLIITGINSTKLQGRFKAHSAANWGVDMYPSLDQENLSANTKNYIDLFDKEKLVYLSADSENTLEKLEDDKIYIIGGIVDKNRHKNICFNKAKEQGIAHAKFPIKEHVNIGDYSTVLTVNQVLWVLLAVKKHDNDWKSALEETLPKRKKSKIKGKNAKDSMKAADQAKRHKSNH